MQSVINGLRSSANVSRTLKSTYSRRQNRYHYIVGFPTPRKPRFMARQTVSETRLPLKDQGGLSLASAEFVLIKIMLIMDEIMVHGAKGLNGLDYRGFGMSPRFHGARVKDEIFSKCKY
jgi:hypothetical protein